MKVHTRSSGRRSVVSSHARACLVSAEMLEHELDLAREVQESLFPAEIPALPGIRVAALNQPARIVSGDLYDIIRVNDDRTVVVCADVSGKGFAAALLAAQVQSYFRAMVQAASVVRSVLESASVSADVFRSLGSLPLLVVRQLNTTACRHMRAAGPLRHALLRGDRWAGWRRALRQCGTQSAAAAGARVRRRAAERRRSPRRPAR